MRITDITHNNNSRRQWNWCISIFVQCVCVKMMWRIWVQLLFFSIRCFEQMMPIFQLKVALLSHFAADNDHILCIDCRRYTTFIEKLVHFFHAQSHDCQTSFDMENVLISISSNFVGWKTTREKYVCKWNSQLIDSDTKQMHCKRYHLILNSSHVQCNRTK